MTEINYEAAVPPGDHPKWNHSYYFNFYDAELKLGGFIRMGILENMREANLWFVFFKDGRPLFQRVNMNLPYADQRLDKGITLAGVKAISLEKYKSAKVSFESADFSVDLVWQELLPMNDCIAMSKAGVGDMAELNHLHLEGVSNVVGSVTLRGGKKLTVNANGFRDIGMGPRDWDHLKHYRLAWPVFDNGLTVALVHGMSTGSDSSFMKMLNRGSGWEPVTEVSNTLAFDDDDMTVNTATWSATAEDGKVYTFTGKPLYTFYFPFDTFMLVEQMMEYRLEDGTVGYGLGECGFRFPWVGNGNE